MLTVERNDWMDFRQYTDLLASMRAICRARHGREPNAYRMTPRTLERLKFAWDVDEASRFPPAMRERPFSLFDDEKRRDRQLTFCGVPVLGDLTGKPDGVVIMDDGT